MRRFRKWLIRAVVATLALLILALGLYAARGPWFERMVLQRVQDSVERHLGGHVAIASLAGDWLTGIELRGITLRDGEVIREIVGGYAEFDLGLWQLWRGQLQDLTQIKFRAERVLVAVPESQLSDFTWAEAEWRQVADRLLRDACATQLLGGCAIEVGDFEVRAPDAAPVDGALRGPLRLDVPARGAGEPIAGTLIAPSVRMQFHGDARGAISMTASMSAVEQFARWVAVLPEDVVGAVELQVEAESAASDLTVIGSVHNVQLAGFVVSQLDLGLVISDQEFTIANLSLRRADEQASLRDYRATLAAPLRGEGVVRVPVAFAKSLLEHLPLGLAEAGQWPAIAAALSGFSGVLEFALRDQALQIKPSQLTAPFANVQLVDGMLPLRPEQLDELRVGFVVELTSEAPSEDALPAWWRESAVRPVGGRVRGALARRDDAFHLQLDADLSLRDREGLTGTLVGQVAMPLHGELDLQPSLLVAGAILRGLPAITVTGRVLASGGAVKLEPLLLQFVDAGSLELRGELAELALDNLLASSVTVAVHDLLVAPLVASLAQMAPSTTAKASAVVAWLAELRDATVNGQLQVGAKNHAELQVTWPERPVLGAMAATLSIDVAADGLVCRDCELRSAVGSVRFDAAMPQLTLPGVLRDPDSILDTELRVAARVQTEPLQDVVATELAVGLIGNVGLDLQVTGSLSKPVVAMQVRESDVALQAMSTNWSRPAGRLRIEAGVCHFDDAGFSIGQTSVLLSGNVATVDGVLRGQLDGSLTQLPGGMPETKLQMRFVVDAEQFVIEQLQLQNDMLRVAGEGLSLAGGRDVWAAVAAGDSRGLVASAMQGSVTVTVPDLTKLQDLSQQRGLAGSATAEVTLAGTLAQPEPSARVRIEGASVRIPEGPRLDDLHAVIIATPVSVDCEQLSATVAGGAIRAHGTFTASQPLWRDWQSGELNFAIEGKDVLLHRRNGIKVRSDLDLTATGPLAHINLKGTLATQASKVVQRMPFFALGHFGGSGAARGLVLAGPDLGEHINVHLDLAVTSKQPIILATNVLAGEVTSALTVRGTLKAPRIEGTMAMPSGTITFPGCVFRTSNALLRFHRNDSAFPTVSLTASGRRHGYDVRLVVRGSYHEPEFQLSSTPPLPPEQLAVLVTTGARPESLRGSRAVGALLGSYLVQELADQLFGSESTEAKEGFVSRFEVETGREISANGTESIVVNFRVVDNIYLQGERDVYEDVNLGIVYRIRFQ